MTEEIRDKIYYIFRTETTHFDDYPGSFPQEGVRFKSLRDSIGYLVESNGEIIFSKNDNNELFLFTINYNQEPPFEPSINAYGRLSEELTNITIDVDDFEYYDFELFGKIVDTGEDLPIVILQEE